LSLVEEFFISPPSMRELPPLPVPTYAGGAAIVNGILFYVGGTTSNNDRSSDLWVCTFSKYKCSYLRIIGTKLII